MIGTARHVLVALHFICPLIFFTNLTRNPYITQIALLNIGLLIAAAWMFWQQGATGEWELPRTRMDVPIFVWLGVCALSWLYAYYGHVPYFRDSMRAEGFRAFLFLLFNAILVFYLAAAASKDCKEYPEIPLGRWTAFVIVWGVLWTFYPSMRSAPGPMLSIQAQLFDPYGTLLWVGGTAVVVWLARSGTVHAVWHAALAVGFLAGTYGIAQYFGMEFLWPKTLNPYGGRSVSTFGNPNFMSSYMVMLLPLAAVYYLQAKTKFQRIVYALVFLVLEMGLCCSLTRSSWMGGLFALLPLLLSKRLRRIARENMEFHGLVATAMLLIAAFWPQSNMGGYTPSLLGRLSEIQSIFEPGNTYSPWYQRCMIWLSAWLMGAENPLLGKGYGLFELFYPFYQGHILDLYDFFRTMRTHANNTHNEIIEVWAQTGIMGVGVLFWTWTVFFQGVWKDARLWHRAPEGVEPEPKKKKKQKDVVKVEPDGERIWLLAGGAGVLGMLVDNLLNVSLHFAVPAFFFWWQAGTVAGNLPYSQGIRRTVRSPGKGVAYAASLVVLLGAMAGSWYWVGYWQREVHYFMGFKLMRSKDFRGAISQLKTAYDWNKLDVNNNYELGNAYARSEQPDKALWAYEEALKVNSGYDEIYYNRATVIAAEGDREKAIRLLEVSWAINPLSPQLYMTLSRLYLQDALKNREKGLRLLKRAVHFFPDDVNFQNNLGYLYNIGGEYEKSESIYVELLRRQPTLEVAEKNLRLSVMRSKRSAPEILAHVASFRHLEKEIQAQRFGPQTLELSRRAAKHFPAFMPAQLYAGNLELMHGHPDRAAKLLGDITRRDPRNIAALLNYGAALAQLGRIVEAQDALKAVLAQDPGNARAKNLLQAVSAARK